MKLQTKEVPGINYSGIVKLFEKLSGLKLPKSAMAATKWRAEKKSLVLDDCFRYAR